MVLHHQDVVYSAAFSHDDTRIVTASGDKTARVWNADGTGKPLLLEGHGAAVVTGAMGGGAFSPDGTQIVTLSDDKTLRVWNADGTGERRVTLVIRALVQEGIVVLSGLAYGIDAVA